MFYILSYMSMTAINLGTSTLNEEMIIDLKDLNNLLVLGRTGSGKSIIRNRILGDILIQKTNQNFDLILGDIFNISEDSVYKDFKKSKSLNVFSTPESLLGELYLLEEKVSDIETFLKKTSYNTLNEYNKDIKLFKYKGKSLWEVSLEEKKSLDYKNFTFGKEIPETLVMLDDWHNFGSNREVEQKIKRLLDIGRKTGVKIIIFGQPSEKEIEKIKSGFKNVLFLKLACDKESYLHKIFKNIQNITEVNFLRGYGEVLFYGKIFKLKTKFNLPDSFAIRGRINLLSPDELRNRIDIFINRSLLLFQKDK